MEEKARKAFSAQTQSCLYCPIHNVKPRKETNALEVNTFFLLILVSPKDETEYTDESLSVYVSFVYMYNNVNVI